MHGQDKGSDGHHQPHPDGGARVRYACSALLCAIEFAMASQ